MSNLLEYENRYYDLGYDYIIGLDEAGRGPMAGELVVAGVIFPKGVYEERIFDSKQLTSKKDSSFLRWQCSLLPIKWWKQEIKM